MYIVLIILTVIVAILMIGIVLIQKSKGGGLSSQFGSGNQVLGVRGTNSFLEKTTWTLAALILVLSVCTAYAMPTGEQQVRAAGTQKTTAPAKPQANSFGTESEAPAAPATPAAPAQAPAAPAQSGN